MSEINYNMTLDIPDNIKSLSLASLVESVADRIQPQGGFSQLQMANILNNIFLRTGLKLDNEQMLFLLDDSKRLLCEASAGSGKTTVSQLKMIKYKLLYNIRGEDILAIAYNDHAAVDMQRRHTVLIEQIMAQRIQGVKLNDRIVCRTFHSNALAWVMEYSNKCGVSNKETMIISDANEEKFMQKAVESVFKKKYIDEAGKQIKEIEPTTVPALISYNAYAEEKLLTVEDSVGNPKFEEIGLPVEDVVDILDRFNKLCTFNSMFTFSNILVKFYNLLKDHEDIRKRIQQAYKVLLVDEYQDMSPLMNEIISLMLNEDTIFNAIGDGDQSIYSFKGTDSLNCLKFRNYFSDGKVVSMGANRRCKKNIVDVARNILSINKLRYPKDIYAINDGGTVETVPYASSAEECSYIISELKKIDLTELYDVCIAYRNKESSLLLSKMLLDARIPFVVKSGYEPYKDIMSSSLYEIFAMLKIPTNKAYHASALYKVVPATRSQVIKLIKEKGDDVGNNCHYLDYDWDSLGSVGQASLRALAVLKECEDALRAGSPMCNFFNKVYRLFSTYYWNWMKEQKKFPEALESNILNDYNSELDYATFLKQYMERIEIRNKFTSNGNGLTLTTFHGLKGLEFQKVFLMDMEESIFPAYDRIEKDCGGNMQAELEMKEECIRLFYVACTRPKDSLVVLYSKDEPSSYMDLLRPMITGKQMSESSKETMLDNINIDVAGIDIDVEDIFEDSTEINVDVDDIIVFDEEEEDINIEDFEVPTDVEVITEKYVSDTDELEFSSMKIEAVNIQEKDINGFSNVADHRMFMYHEPSDSYYMIEPGEVIRDDIDTAFSREITEEEYNEGLRQQRLLEINLASSIPDKPKAKEETNKLNSTLGILNFLND